MFTILKLARICSCGLLDPIRDIFEERLVNRVSFNDPFKLIKDTLITKALNIVDEDYGKK